MRTLDLRELAGAGWRGEFHLGFVALARRRIQAVRKYGVEKRRVPKSLDELVAAGYLSQVPQAPPGKRFEIDQKLQVQLVND